MRVIEASLRHSSDSHREVSCKVKEPPLPVDDCAVFDTVHAGVFVVFGEGTIFFLGGAAI